MRLTKILLAAALPLTLSLACGGSASDSSGDGDSSSGDKKEKACETFCSELEACEGVEVEQCVDSCTGNETTSVAGQQVISECFDAELCQAEDEAALESALVCLLTGASDLDLSEEAETYCGESVDTINECLGSEPVGGGFLGNCDDAIGLASDEILEDLNACAKRPCEQVEACVTRAALGALPLEAILDLEAGGAPSPALFAELLTVAVVFGQLGLEDVAGDLLGDMGGDLGR